MCLPRFVQLMADRLPGPRGDGLRQHLKQGGFSSSLSGPQTNQPGLRAGGNMVRPFSDMADRVAQSTQPAPQAASPAPQQSPIGATMQAGAGGAPLSGGVIFKPNLKNTSLSGSTVVN